MISNAVLLFLVIDPFGLIPVYVALLGRVPAHRRVPVLVRELLIALFALVLFLFAGRYVLSALRISEPALLIAGALILFLIALPMIFPSVKLRLDSETQAEPLIVPLAGDARTARQGRASSSIDFNFPCSKVSSAGKWP